MEIKEKLSGLRKDKGLTQDEMAQRLFLTRQAISRWETGETTPNTDTLKLISKEFHVSINELLGEPQDLICQSCSMSLQNFDEFGTEIDGGINPDYCFHCYKDGAFTHNRTLDEMIDVNMKFLDEFNKQNDSSYTEDEARAILKMHLPTLKRWREKK